MTCFSKPIPTVNCNNNFEQKKKSLWFSLNEKSHRKALRLLFKQYEVDCIVVEPPEYSDGMIVRERPILIKYYNPKNPKIIFEWIIKPSDFKMYY